MASSHIVAKMDNPALRHHNSILSAICLTYRNIASPDLLQGAFGEVVC